MTFDLAAVSRAQQRKDTMLQHPIFLYQVADSVDVDDDDANGRQYEITWRTDRVFATYEEAKAYGDSNRHNDGDEGKGWRVWSVPAAGALRDLLAKAMAP